MTFTLDVLRHEEVFAIPNDVGEMGNPVAEDNHARLFSELEVNLDVTMSVDEIVDVGVVLDVFLSEKHEMLAVFTHIGRFLVIRTLHAAVLGPVESKPHAPARMKGREGPLTGAVVEDTLDEFEALVRITQTVTMRQEENLTIKFSGLRLLVEDDTTLLFQITIGPYVVVACEVMHFDTHIS